MDTLCIAADKTDFSAYGTDFVQILAIMSDLPDTGWEAFPQDWRDVAGHLNLLLLDHGLSAAEAAKFAGVPVSFAIDYADARGI